MSDCDEWRPEWKAWRSRDRSDLIAPVDAYYAGWREAIEKVFEIVAGFDGDKSD